ncbi:MAG: hypothetical protein PHH36_01675 [Sideroxydans sp.]|nr:hypothetical protein [Sideroxydans sp.]
MRQKLILTAKFLILIGLGFVLGTVFGFREGMFAYKTLDATPRGKISMMNLRSIEKQNFVSTKLILNNDIDQGLYFYSLLQDQWWHPLFEVGIIGGVGASTRYSEYVSDLANFRKANPALNENPALFDQVPKDMEEHTDWYRELAISHRDRLARIKSATEKYSTTQIEITEAQSCEGK